MNRHVQLVAIVLLCALSTGCFYGRPRIKQLGPDRVLTDAEVKKAEQKIVEADKVWAARIEPANVQKALDFLQESLKLAPHNTQALWRAARASYWLAEQAGLAKDEKKQFSLAEIGASYAKHAIFVDTESAEGNYFLALNFAMQADAAKTKGLAMIKPMLDALKRANELNEQLDYAGPRRVMGQIYLEAPPWPTSVGDPEQAMELLEDAIEDHPNYPENHLVLAEAAIKLRQHNKARKQLERVLAAQPAPDWTAELPRWQKKAQELLKKLPQK
jgi:tetratricopeptide (TPR) repeat protein